MVCCFLVNLQVKLTGTPWFESSAVRAWRTGLSGLVCDRFASTPGLSYQDEASEGFQVELNAGNLDTEQQDDEGILDIEQLEDEDCVQVDASVVDNLRRKWKKKTKHEENDETLWQYVSDNEGPTSLDDDDDSDVD